MDESSVVLGAILGVVLLFFLWIAYGEGRSDCLRYPDWCETYRVQEPD